LEWYYAKRALEYEEIYNREEPKRRAELEDTANALKETLKDRKVLEIACGTGYWSLILSQAAKKIVATDIAKETLEIAQIQEILLHSSFSSWGTHIHLLLMKSLTVALLTFGFHTSHGKE
jgi:protein-L-isoaspartate O-methyltransferase